MTDWVNRANMSDEATEHMARVIAEIAAGKVLDVGRGGPARWRDSSLVRDAIVIDVRGVYSHWMANDGGSYMYEDHHVAPPWQNAMLVYANSVMNVLAMHMISWDIESEGEWERQWQPEHGDHVIEWDRVRWVISATVFSGGQHSSGIRVPTAGPMVWWRIAVYPDGEIADIHWTLLAKDMDVHDFDNALMTTLATLDLCNCVNVHVAEPTRSVPRAQRRRIARTGVRFSEIHIRPQSVSYRGKGPGVPFADMPFHGVRGHFSEYGVNGKGLLFGKLAGRFWIPPHVRGSKTEGEVLQEYVAES